MALKFLLVKNNLCAASCRIPHSLISAGFETHSENRANKLGCFLLFFFHHSQKDTVLDIKIETVTNALII